MPRYEYFDVGNVQRASGLQRRPVCLEERGGPWADVEQGGGSDPAAFTFHLRPSSFRLILYPLTRLQPLRHTSAPKACALIGD